MDMNEGNLRVSSARKVNITELEKKAVEWMYQTPSFISVFRHAEGEEDTEVSCITRGTKIVKLYLIPKQFIVVCDDDRYGHFVFTWVIEKASGVPYWLIVQYGCTNGFLLSSHDFSSEEEVLPQVA